LLLGGNHDSGHRAKAALACLSSTVVASRTTGGTSRGVANEGAPGKAEAGCVVCALHPPARCGKARRWPADDKQHALQLAIQAHCRPCSMPPARRTALESNWPQLPLIATGPPDDCASTSESRESMSAR
jgi:hypothetical protein